MATCSGQGFRATVRTTDYAASHSVQRHGPDAWACGVVSANKNSRISATRGPHNIGLTPYQPDILLLMFKLLDVSECRTLRRSLCSSSEACRSHRLCVLQVVCRGLLLVRGVGFEPTNPYGPRA